MIDTNRFMEDTIYRIKVIGIILAPVIIVYLIWYAFAYRKTVTAELIGTDWERTYTIQRYMTVEEDAWSVPDGGRVYDRKWKHRRTDKQEDGTYSCPTDSDPRKRCKKYKDVKVYDWRYYYHIDRWVPEKVVKTSGSINSAELIYWPNIDDIVQHSPVQLGDQRAGNPTERYTLIFQGDKIYRQDVHWTVFIAYPKGTKCRITVNILGAIIRIERIV